MSRVVLPVPAKPVTVHIPVKIGDELAKYTWDRWPDAALRMFQRFRYLVMSAALLDGRESCREIDIDRAVHQFADYWEQMVASETVEDSAPV